MSNAAKILVVDDTPQNVKLLADILGAKGYSVVTAALGTAALEQVEKEHPDLVLLDVVMPGMSGYEVCRRIRENPQTTILPVVMVTSLDPAEERIKGIEVGADDFLTKPINQAELLARVRSLLRVKTSYDTAQRAKELAERANLDKSRFLAAASHDLRQPMHALNLWVGNLHVALDRGDTNAARRAAEAIEHSTQSMSASFNAILDLSKLEAQGIQPEITDVELGELLEYIREDFEPIAREKGLDLRLRRSRRAPRYVRSDPALLGRVLRNLVSNAIKYTHKGGVVIGAVALPAHVRIDVRDSGIGIPDQYREDIFKEFFQIGNRERDRRSGLGLGLSIVRRSIDILEGHRLSQFSREGRGSRFSVQVPASEKLAETAAAAHVAEPSERIPGSYVVVVDDERSILDGLVQLLTNWGCLVEGGSSGAEIVAAVSQNERLPDLIITDLRLANGETGVDVVRLLHRSLSAAVPVLVLTGDPATQVTLEDAQTPVRLMHKPIVAETLREALDEMLPARRFI